MLVSTMMRMSRYHSIAVSLMTVQLLAIAFLAVSIQRVTCTSSASTFKSLIPKPKISIESAATIDGDDVQKSPYSSSTTVHDLYTTIFRQPNPWGVLKSTRSHKLHTLNYGSKNDCHMTLRGGDSEPSSIRKSLDEKVHAAMRKLGLTPPPRVRDENSFEGILHKSLPTAVLDDKSEHNNNHQHDDIDLATDIMTKREPDAIVMKKSTNNDQSQDKNNQNNENSNNDVDIKNNSNSSQVVCKDGVCQMPSTVSNNVTVEPVETTVSVDTVEDNVGTKLQSTVNSDNNVIVEEDVLDVETYEMNDSLETDTFNNNQNHLITDDVETTSSDIDETVATSIDSSSDTVEKLEDVLSRDASNNNENNINAESSKSEPLSERDVHTLADVIAKDMHVDVSLALAALGATAPRDDSGVEKYNESAARELIKQELDIIEQIPAESPMVHQLVAEGHSKFLARRALAFAEGDMENARAILEADKQDEEEEAASSNNEANDEGDRNTNANGSIVNNRASDKSVLQQAIEEEKKSDSFKTVTVNSNIDPLRAPVKDPPSFSAPKEPSPPKPANKADVVFEATTAQIQELVLESPVPVLLDVYADWCGPCKVLGPALEEMAVKMGGAFRLVKVNSDRERPITTALQVSALPTVFGIRDGKILHMFQGMPSSDENMRNFMMGLLIPGQAFKPPVTPAEKEKYAAMTTQLIKVAGAACFPFAAREKLQDRINNKLDDLVKESGGVLEAEEAAKILRSLFSNIVKNPTDTKFRKINLTNKVVAAKVGKFPSALAILKSVGFSMDHDKSAMTFHKSKKIVNVAPLSVARDTIDKWMDQKRYELAKAARKRKDEEARAQLDLGVDEEEEATDTSSHKNTEKVDHNACKLQVRIDGKKKLHAIELQADDTLDALLDMLPAIGRDQRDSVQVTCVAKRLIIKSSDKTKWQSTLRDIGLVPGASLVVKIGAKDDDDVDNYQKTATTTADTTKKSKLAERASSKKKLKKGSHTMQSIGIYAKDDNAKAELIDGGGGTWYEHDVTDDEDEASATTVSVEETKVVEEEIDNYDNNFGDSDNDYDHDDEEKEE